MMKKNASTLKLVKNLFQINQTDIEMSVFFLSKNRLMHAEACEEQTGSGH